MVMDRSQGDILVETLNKNCNAAEDHALQLLSSCEIPVIPALRTLTKGDCMHALWKHATIFNSQEQAIFLSVMTDYVTCAYKNDELFDLFPKGNKHSSLAYLLAKLESEWLKFFVQLKTGDLTYLQLKSLVSMLKHSINRTTDCKLILKTVLAAGQVKLDRIQSSLCLESFASTSLSRQPESGKNSKSLCHNGGKAEAEIPNMCVVKLQNVLVPKIKSPPAPKITIILDSENEARSPKLPPKRKYGADIKKYILKANKNRFADHKVEVKSTIKCIELDTEILGSRKSQVMNTTTPQSSVMCITLDSPSSKKQQLEDRLPEGKMNAFDVLMRNSKLLKRK